MGEGAEVEGLDGLVAVGAVVELFVGEVFDDASLGVIEIGVVGGADGFVGDVDGIEDMKSGCNGDLAILGGGEGLLKDGGQSGKKGSSRLEYLAALYLGRWS